MVICIVLEGFGAIAGEESDVAAVGLGTVLIWRPMALGLAVFVVMPTMVLVTLCVVTCIVTVVLVGVHMYPGVTRSVTSKRAEKTLMRYSLIFGVEIERLETIPVAERVMSPGWDLGEEAPPILNIL